MVIGRGIVLVSLAKVSLLGPLAAQSLKISVSDKSTKQPVANATVVLRDSLQAALQTVVTDADGIAQFRLSRPGGYWVTAKKIGYLPAPTKALTVNAGERVTIGLNMAPLPVRLDSVVSQDKKDYPNLTSGEEFFRRHAELAKGHFFLGPEIKKSKLTVTEFLVARIDSLQFTPISPKPQRGDPGRPVIPASGTRFLTSNFGSQCLYARIDRFDIAYLLWNFGKSNIDDLLDVDDIVGVEMFANYHDVPAEWRMDAATPSSIQYVMVLGGPPFVIGRVGLGQNASANGTSGGSNGPGPLLTCPFLQIWTNLAW